MVGIIVTGHGNFATGVLSAAKLIAGTPEKLIGIDFTENDTVETLEEKIKKGIEELDTEEILVLADLAGGSPFKVSATIGVSSDKNIKVLSGTNLGMIIETALLRDGKNLEEVVAFAKESGVTSIQEFEMKVKKEIEDCEDGI
ncbi:PTS galactosamine/N-acetylgalactosamine transporter subunit IIA [Clostridium thermobutyricum]|uniref:PTS galactosamine/N-acetylgalactosamine transporter subunit IIA n=1 Tax=Clostridium thermobutyricum TaxID=29372 RepID=UPI0029435701|nr:PTS galactosamine/N-acetylgalactosamine transporter subunit IIA [Clostridium thermobutyricum]